MMIGKSLFEYIIPEQREKIYHETAKRREGSNSQYEVDIVTARGNRRTIMVSLSPRRDRDGHFIGALGTVLDVTETKQLRAKIDRAKRLEAAGRIAGQVAHDFNNLLGPLATYPEMIRAKVGENDPIIRYVNAIEKAAKQMMEVNQELLTLGRRGQYQVVPLDLNAVVNDTLNQLGPLPLTIILDKRLDPNICEVQGNAAQLQRVIGNLFANAIDAMPTGGRLSIGTEICHLEQEMGTLVSIPRGGYVRLTIADSGTGIPPDIQTKIFEPFYSTKTPDTTRGSGLGLSIVDAVIKDHHGYVDCISDPGHGTTFHIYLPIEEQLAQVLGLNSVSHNRRGPR